MQYVFSKWLWEIDDARSALELIIKDGFKIIHFQVVPDMINDDFYLIVVAEKVTLDPVLSEN